MNFTKVYGRTDLMQIDHVWKSLLQISQLRISEITFDFAQCVRILIPPTNTSPPILLQDAQRALRRIRGR